MEFQLAMSVDVGWMFSCAQILLSHICNQLSPQSIREILCLGSWVEFGFLDEKKMMELLGKGE
jgi:hypothetical protein